MKYTLLIFFLSTGTILQAQNLTFNISSDIILREHDEYQGLIHSDSTGHIIHLYERSGKGLLNHPGRMLILEKYDTQLNQVFSYEYGSSDMISIELASIGSELVWIVMEKSGSYKYTYSMIPIGLDGKEGKKQFLFDNKVTSAKDIPSTYINISPDSTHVAFTAVFDSDSKKKETEIFTAAFNNNGLVWDKSIKLKGNQKQYELSEIQLANNNNLLILSKYFKNDKGKDTVKDRNDRKKAGYTMSILQLTANNKSPKKIPIDLDGSFVHQAKMLLDPYSNHIHCSGLTSIKSGGNINGVFSSVFDEQLNIINTEQRKFDSEDLIFLHKEDVDVNFSANKGGLDDEHILCSMHLDSDGNKTLVVEENYIRRNNNNMGGVGFNNTGFNNSIELFSNDIVLLKLSSEGNISNISVIPKKQSTSLFRGRSFFNPNAQQLRKSDFFLSHDILTHNQDLFVFFNEHKDNFDEGRRRKRIDRIGKMMGAFVHITNNSEPILKPLFSDYNNDFLIAPTRSRQINKDTYFVTLSEPRRAGKRKIRIGTISID